MWLVRSDQARNKAKCKICTTSEGQFKTFSVAEGYTAVTKHFQANLVKIQTDPDHNVFEVKAGEKSRSPLRLK